MPISHKHRVVFLHNPKAAGTSIESALGIPHSAEALLCTKYLPDHVYALQHLPFQELKRKLHGTAVWREYAKVTVVRNPWDRLVSDWKWRRQGGLAWGNLSFPEFVRHVERVRSAAGGGDGTDGWVAHMQPTEFASTFSGHFLPQVSFVEPLDPPLAAADAAAAADTADTAAGAGGAAYHPPPAAARPEDRVRVLRFERLSRDWRAFCRDAKLGKVELPVLNDTAGAGAHYSEAYGGDQALIDTVGRLFQADVDRWQYTFETQATAKKAFRSLLDGLGKKSKARAPTVEKRKPSAGVPRPPSTAAAEASTAPPAVEPAHKRRKPNAALAPAPLSQGGGGGGGGADAEA